MFFREYCGLLASIFSSFQASTLSRSPRLGFHMLYFKDDLISLELPGAFRQVSFLIAYISPFCLATVMGGLRHLGLFPSTPQIPKPSFHSRFLGID